MINSGQITRKEAMIELQKSPEYPRLGNEAKVMKYPKRSHDEFKKDEKVFNFISSIVGLWKS